MSLRAARIRASRIAGIAGITTVSLSLALVVAPPAASAQSPARPTITAVGALAWTHPSGLLAVTTTLANRTRHTSARASLRAYLSKDKHLSRHDVAMRGAVTVARLRPHRHVVKHRRFAVPRTARPGRYWLLACSAGRCRAAKTAIRVTATPTTSADLIAAARSAHKISAGTAITYGVLAEFGDTRLPVRYRGDDALVAGDSSTRAAVDHWSSMSTRQRAMVGAYLQGPSSAAGWRQPAKAARNTFTADACPHNPPKQMDHVDAPSGPVRVWYEDNDRYAATVAPKLARDAAHIYQSFKNLMGRGLPSDRSFCGFNGGDGHYDVYILDPAGFPWKGFAATTTYKGYRGKAAPAFTAFSSAPDRWQLAHELFHAFQFAYKHAAPLDDYQGFDEGAADWAGNYVYPHDEDEHFYDTMLLYPDVDTFPDNGYGYELWPFDLYLTEKFGNRLIPQIYQEFQHQPALRAVNSVIPGGFANRLPEFARYGWNQTPVKGGFRAWDRFDAVPSVAYQQPLRPTNLHLGDLEQRTLNLPANLTPLARGYHSLHVDDQHIHDLLFTNTLKGIQGTSVQAFVKLNDGTWHTQDWTNKKTVEFCRDNGPDQNVTDLVIMYGNARYYDKGALKLSKPPTLQLRNNCDRYYRVTKVTGTYHEDISVTDTSHSYSCTDSGTQDFTITYDPARPTLTGPTDGQYTPHGIGELFVPSKLNGSRHYQQTNCVGGSPFLQPCDATLSSPTLYLVGIGDVFSDHDPVPVQVPNLRHQDPFDEVCDDDGYGWFNSDNPQYMDPSSVRRAALQGAAAFTITAANTFDDHAGHKYSCRMTITVQPTDEDGRPLQ